MANKQGAGFHGVDSLKYAVLGGDAATVKNAAYVVGISLSRQISKTQKHANNRMVCEIASDNGYSNQLIDMYFNRCGSAPIYLGESTGGDISVPVKFQNPIIKIWGSGSYLMMNEQKNDSYITDSSQDKIRLGKWYIIKYFEPAGGVDIDSTTTRLFTSVKVCIDIEGYGV